MWCYGGYRLSFSWRLPDVFVSSASGALHRVVRHATNAMTIAQLESTSSAAHLACDCMLDNGQPICWIGNGQYRQAESGEIFVVHDAVTTPPLRVTERKTTALLSRDSVIPSYLERPEKPVPTEVLLLKNSYGCSLTRAWREHLSISTEEMAHRLGVPQAVYVNVERVHPQPSRGILQRVATALGISVEQLDENLG